MTYFSAKELSDYRRDGFIVVRVMSRIEKFSEYSPELKNLACDQRMLGRVGELLNDTPVLFKEKINFKLPGGERMFGAGRRTTSGCQEKNTCLRFNVSACGA